MEENTKYAGPTRSTREESEASLTLLRSKDFFKEVFGAINSIAAILDKNRLVVFANDLFLKTMGFDSLESLLGKRPGEAISCIHSAEDKYGCGTSAVCSVCGAVNAIIESQETNKKVSRETRITALKDGNTISWDLKVTSSPVSFLDEKFYFFTVEDISAEKRKAALERIFFHDILNTAGGLNGLLTIPRSRKRLPCAKLPVLFLQLRWER